MSNVIPIVSSSPPPLDDDSDGNFKWGDDDDDDEYGNFASAASISATTVTSDTSIAYNWSNSEVSLATDNTLSMNNNIKLHSNESEINISNSNCNRTENINPGNHMVSSDWSQCNDYDDDNFGDFANFNNTEFSEIPVQAAVEETENNLSVHDVTVSAEKAVALDDAADFDEDEFQDFAQFNEETTVSESQLNLLSGKSESLEQKGATDINSTEHSLKDEQISDQNQCALTIVGDFTSSAHMKNNDSVYSYASTTDSGVFSADMSPSCHPNEVSETCLYIQKSDALTNTFDLAHQADIPTTSTSISKEIIETDEDLNLHSVSEVKSNNVISDVVEGNDTCDKYALAGSSIHHESYKHRLSNNNLSDSLNSTAIEGCVDEDGGHREFSDDDIEDSVEEPTAQQTMHSSSSSCLSTENKSDVVDTGSSGGFVQSSDITDEENVIDAACKIVDKCTSENSSLPEDVRNVFQNEFRATDDDNYVASEDDVEFNNQRTIQQLVGVQNLDSCDSEKMLEVSCVSAWKDNDNSITEKSVTPQSNYVHDGVDNAVDICNESASSVPVVSLSESADKDVDDLIDDAEEEEFEGFGISVSQKDDNDDSDSNEVAPITFRTSICEPAVDGDEDDFRFEREIPPAVDHEHSDSNAELRQTNINISDDEDADDFGDFDSAQNLTASDSVNKNNDDSDDGFGKFGDSQAAHDDAGWADFGSPIAPKGTEGTSMTTEKQVSVPAHLEQSKTEKLRHAVINCFPESSTQASSSHSETSPVHESETQSQSPNDGQGTSPCTEGEDPLPLDTVVDLGLSKALEAKQQTWTVVQHPAKKDPKVRLWAHLKDVDSCHALMYGWQTSHCSKEVFSTLHIDTQNTLFTHKKQAVPFFASGVGILEPIRSGGSAQDRKKGKNSLGSTNQSMLLESKYDSHPSTATQDIPPVDFDWSSSGLTNPLTVFKADSQNSAPSALQPLEEMMKKTTPTAKLSTNEVWSPETVRVLEKMPDLSFMLSRVLMFPVKQ